MVIESSHPTPSRYVLEYDESRFPLVPCDRAAEQRTPTSTPSSSRSSALCSDGRSTWRSSTGRTQTLAPRHNAGGSPSGCVRTPASSAPTRLAQPSWFLRHWSAAPSQPSSGSSQCHAPTRSCRRWPRPSAGQRRSCALRGLCCRRRRVAEGAVALPIPRRGEARRTAPTRSS